MWLSLAIAVDLTFDQEKCGSCALEQLTATSMNKKVVSKTVVVHFDTNINILKQITDANTSACV